MSLNLPVFYTRTITAVVFVAIMLTGLLWNNWSFLVLVCVIEVACLNEYFMIINKITGSSPLPVRILFILFGLFNTVFYFLMDNAGYNDTVYYWTLTCFAGIVVAVITFFIFFLLKKNNAIMKIYPPVIGLFYTVIPMIMLLKLHFWKSYVPITIIVMIWLNDTMAYILGSFIGKTKLSEASPNKTWEGTISGIILTIAFTALVSIYFKSTGTINWVIFAFIVTVSGTYGDLLESKLKRLAGVKDSGKILPGHGGALDRFDSLLFAVPVSFIFVFWFMLLLQ